MVATRRYDSLHGMFFFAFIHANDDCHHMIFVSYFAVVATPSLLLRRDAPKFKGWHYNAFAGAVPRRRVHGRDLEKTIPTPIVTFESIDSIPSLHDFAQYFSSHDVSLISQDSSIDDVLSSSTAFSLPTGVGLGILGLTRKEGRDPFDGLGICTLPSDTCPRRLEQFFFALPRPSRSTLGLNTEGVDGGNTLVDHEVTADYTQGMFAGIQGGSPVHADDERRDSADWQGRDGRTLLLLA
ncbi:uncharacterized protein ARMOST_20826 [Armillaria ostoyae]|uniref:Uncharacterized protein n=1 Tax=Armillaria ostoyae TaxID=47428 RepID=A0A284S8D7_ARMOS|nr:uncharacterized protein ARMOST_20826 [Armillaria ostoyae]